MVNVMAVLNLMGYIIQISSQLIPSFIGKRRELIEALSVRISTGLGIHCYLSWSGCPFYRCLPLGNSHTNLPSHIRPIKPVLSSSGNRMISVIVGAWDYLSRIGVIHLGDILTLSWSLHSIL